MREWGGGGAQSACRGARARSGDPWGRGYRRRRGWATRLRGGELWSGYEVHDQGGLNEQTTHHHQAYSANSTGALWMPSNYI